MKHKFIFSLTSIFVSFALFACGATPPSPGVTLSSIAVTHLPDKVEYFVNETFDATGLQVTATYSDDSKQLVSDYTLSDVDMTTAGQKDVTVTYQEKTTSFSVTVKEHVTLTGIRISREPTNLTYITGETFDKLGLKVVAVYSDQSEIELGDNDYQIAVPDMSEAGTKTVTVSYQGFTATFTITVMDPPPVVTLVRIQVTREPTKTIYEVNEQFSSDGLEVTATYSDGSTKVVTGYTLSTVDTSSSGTKTVTVTFNSVTTTFEITVRAPVTVTGLRLNIDNVKVQYFVGDALDTEGLKVYLVYSDQSTKEVTEFTVDNVDMSTPGNKVVTVHYGTNLTATYTVEVKLTEEEEKANLILNLLNIQNARVKYTIYHKDEGTQNGVAMSDEVTQVIVSDYTSNAVKTTLHYWAETQTSKLSDVYAITHTTTVEELKAVFASMGMPYENYIFDEENDAIISTNEMDLTIKPEYFYMYDETNKQNMVYYKYGDRSQVYYFLNNQDIVSFDATAKVVGRIVRALVNEGTYSKTDNIISYQDTILNFKYSDFGYYENIQVSNQSFNIRNIVLEINSNNTIKSMSFTAGSELVDNIEYKLEFSNINTTTIDLPTIPQSAFCHHEAPLKYEQHETGHRVYCSQCHKYLEEADHRIDDNHHICVDCGYVENGEYVDNKLLKLNEEEDFVIFNKSGDEYYFDTYFRTSIVNKALKYDNNEKFVIIYDLRNQHLGIAEKTDIVDSEYNCREYLKYHLTIFNVDYTKEALASVLGFVSEVDPITGETVINYEQLYSGLYNMLVNMGYQGETIKDYELMAGQEVLLEFDFLYPRVHHPAYKLTESPIDSCHIHEYYECTVCHEAINEGHEKENHEYQVSVIEDTTGLEPFYKNSNEHLFLQVECKKCNESFVFEVADPSRIENHSNEIYGRFHNRNGESYSGYLSFKHQYDENHVCSICGAKEIKQITPIDSYNLQYRSSDEFQRARQYYYFYVEYMDGTSEIVDDVNFSYGPLKTGNNIIEGSFKGEEFAFVIRILAENEQPQAADPYIFVSYDNEIPYGHHQEIKIFTNVDIEYHIDEGHPQTYFDKDNYGYNLQFMDPFAETVKIRFTVPDTTIKKEITIEVTDEIFVESNRNNNENYTIDIMEGETSYLLYYIMDDPSNYFRSNVNFDEFEITIESLDSSNISYDEVNHFVTGIKANDRLEEAFVITFTKGEFSYSTTVKVYVEEARIKNVYLNDHFFSNEELEEGLDLSSLDFEFEGIADPENVTYDYELMSQKDDLEIVDGVLKVQEGQSVTGQINVTIWVNFHYKDSKSYGTSYWLTFEDPYFSLGECWITEYQSEDLLSDYTNISDMSRIVFDIPEEYKDLVIIENGIITVGAYDVDKHVCTVAYIITGTDIEGTFNVNIREAEIEIITSNSGIVFTYNNLDVYTGVNDDVEFEILSGEDKIEIVQRNNDYIIIFLETGDVSLRAFVTVNGEKVYSNTVNITIDDIYVHALSYEVNVPANGSFDLQDNISSNYNDDLIKAEVVTGGAQCKILGNILYVLGTEEIPMSYRYVLTVGGQTYTSDPITINLVDPAIWFSSNSQDVFVDNISYVQYNTNVYGIPSYIEVVSGGEHISIVGNRITGLTEGDAVVSIYVMVNGQKYSCQNPLTIHVLTPTVTLKEGTSITAPIGFINLSDYFNYNTPNVYFSIDDSERLIYENEFYDEGEYVLHYYYSISSREEAVLVGEVTLNIVIPVLEFNDDELVLSSYSRNDISDIEYQINVELPDWFDIGFVVEDESVAVVEYSRYIVALGEGETNLVATIYYYGNELSTTSLPIVVEEDPNLAKFDNATLPAFAEANGFLHDVQLPSFEIVYPDLGNTSMYTYTDTSDVKGYGIKVSCAVTVGINVDGIIYGYFDYLESLGYMTDANESDGIGFFNALIISARGVYDNKGSLVGFEFNYTVEKDAKLVTYTFHDVNDYLSGMDVNPTVKLGGLYFIYTATYDNNENTYSLSFLYNEDVDQVSIDGVNFLDVTSDENAEIDVCYDGNTVTYQAHVNP